MSRLARRAFVFVAVTAATAVGSSWWLYEGDLAAAVEPVVPEWNADQLAIRAGIVGEPPPDLLGAPADPTDDRAD